MRLQQAAWPHTSLPALQKRALHSSSPPLLLGRPWRAFSSSGSPGRGPARFCAKGSRRASIAAQASEQGTGSEVYNPYYNLFGPRTSSEGYESRGGDAKAAPLPAALTEPGDTAEAHTGTQLSGASGGEPGEGACFMTGGLHAKLLHAGCRAVSGFSTALGMSPAVPLMPNSSVTHHPM